MAASAKPLPSIDPDELDAYLTASITLVNLADDRVSVGVAYVDPATSDPFHLGTYELSFSDQLSQSVPPGVYELRFEGPGVGATTQRCTVEIGDTDEFVFATLGGAVAVSRVGDAPTRAADLFVSTSSLCQS